MITSPFAGTHEKTVVHHVPAILIRCRRTLRIVPTGLTTEKVEFTSLVGIQFSMVSPACGQIHHWKQQDVWVEGSEGRRIAANVAKFPVTR